MEIDLETAVEATILMHATHSYFLFLYYAATHPVITGSIAILDKMIAHNDSIYLINVGMFLIFLSFI